MAVAGFAHQGKDLAQGRDRRARHRLLVGKLLGIGAVRPDPADVVFFYLRKRQPDEGNAGRGDIGAVGPAREVGIEAALMGDDERAVGRDADVELQRVHAHRQRVGERGKRVFGPQRAAAPVGFDVEGHDLSMDAKEKDGRSHHPPRHASPPLFRGRRSPPASDCAARDPGYATG